MNITGEGSLPERITERELEILRYVQDGFSNHAIAQALVLSINTVKWHLAQIFRKLGVSSRTQAVAAGQVLGLFEEQATITSLASWPTLPTYLTPLIGRDAEQTALSQLLTNPSIQLVTLLGPGGIGKTRLAVAVASLLQNTFPDGIAFAALEEGNTVEDVLSLIVEGIGLRFYGRADLKHQLLSGLYDRQMLLVLDSFEHMLEASSLVAEFLANFADLTILITSREKLNIVGEVTYAIGGLAYPTVDNHMGEYSAIHLFEQEARQIQPNFEPTTEDQTHIGRICQLVEGLPLAIKLAAGWIGILSPNAIATEITQSIDILRTQAKDIPDRHRSIQAVFDHSWRLLTLDEQATIQHLAVFRGGFDREATQQVAGIDLFMLRTLVDKSLVTRTGPNRFEIHDLVRRFVEKKLLATPEYHQQILDKHCVYYAACTQYLEEETREHNLPPIAITTRILSDRGNFLAAWQRALEQPLVSEFDKFAHCVAEYYATLGLNRQGLREFQSAIQHLRAEANDESTGVLGRCLAFLGVSCLLLGKLDEAQHALEEAVSLLAGHADVQRVVDLGHALNFLGWTTYLQGNTPRARQLLNESQRAWQKSRYLRVEWFCFFQLAIIEYGERQYDSANHYLHQTLQFAQVHAYSFLPQVFAFAILGHTASATGDFAEAAQYLRKSLHLNRDFHAQGYLASEPLFIVLFGIAALYGRQRQPEPALELLAIGFDHPQCGETAKVCGRIVRNEFQSLFSSEMAADALENVPLGTPFARYLSPHFVLNSQLIDHLLELIEQASKSS